MKNFKSTHIRQECFNLLGYAKNGYMSIALAVRDKKAMTIMYQADGFKATGHPTHEIAIRRRMLNLQKKLSNMRETDLHESGWIYQEDRLSRPRLIVQQHVGKKEWRMTL